MDEEKCERFNTTEAVGLCKDMCKISEFMHSDEFQYAKGDKAKKQEKQVEQKEKETRERIKEFEIDVETNRDLAREDLALLKYVAGKHTNMWAFHLDEELDGKKWRAKES